MVLISTIMDSKNKKIGFCNMRNLIFSFLLIGCFEGNNKNNNISVQWEEGKATGIFIPRQMIASISGDSVQKLLKVYLINSTTPVLGEYTVSNSAVVFRPLISFTPGLKYEVHLSGKLIGQIAIPPNDPHDAPAIINIYPTQDTLPENLLKFYIHFSKSMQEGNALQHVLLTRDDSDTVSSAFLDLQPELWNKEKTIITLWLDPGRIKRDLQPNKKSGSPLQQGAKYQLVIRKGLRDASGTSSYHNYHKNFVAGFRDSLSPDPAHWTLEVPAAGNNQPLKIYLHEHLDFILLINTIRIVDSYENVLPGTMEVSNEETILSFIPSAIWKSGIYTLEIESRLEDLAGNNLVRLFDSDLTHQKLGDKKDVFKRSFDIR
jgi:hypothetical protein